MCPIKPRPLLPETKGDSSSPKDAAFPWACYENLTAAGTRAGASVPPHSLYGPFPEIPSALVHRLSSQSCHHLLPRLFASSHFLVSHKRFPLTNGETKIKKSQRSCLLSETVHKPEARLLWYMGDTPGSLLSPSFSSNRCRPPLCTLSPLAQYC